MKYLRDIGPGSVPLDMLRRYLAATGWQTRSAPVQPTAPQGSVGRLFMEARSGGRRNFDVYVSDNQTFKDIELVIPSTVESPDYAAQAFRVIEALSALQNRSIEEIASSIREVGFDVVRSRIPDIQVKDDTIHLEVARSFISGIRTVLATAATTELAPSPYFLRLKKEGSEFADRCRFGHTFKGSFGFTVESPLQSISQESLPGIVPAAPFERRVMQRLTRGLHTVAKAVYEDSTKPILNNVQVGFNANLCEQLASLVEDTSPSGIAFDFSFSPEWHAPHDIAPESESFFVSKAQVEIIKAAAKELRAQIQSSDETVYGRVTRLASDADPSDLTDLMGEREVAILWSSDAFGDISVRAALSPADYLKAVEAHAAGRPIELSGTLERRPRRWVLVSPSNLILHD